MASTEDGYSAGGSGVNAMADIATANRLARVIEDAEASRLGVRVGKARRTVARRIGASPGTLENIRRLRLKTIPNYLMARIRAEFVAVLQREIRRLEHEISLHTQAGVDHHDDDLAKAQAQLDAAKAILGK